MVVLAGMACRVAYTVAATASCSPPQKRNPSLPRVRKSHAQIKLGLARRSSMFCGDAQPASRSRRVVLLLRHSAVNTKPTTQFCAPLEAPVAREACRNGPPVIRVSFTPPPTAMRPRSVLRLPPVGRIRPWAGRGVSDAASYATRREDESSREATALVTTLLGRREDLLRRQYRVAFNSTQGSGRLCTSTRRRLPAVTPKRPSQPGRLAKAPAVRISLAQPHRPAGCPGPSSGEATFLSSPRGASSFEAPGRGVDFVTWKRNAVRHLL